ncbi:MAG: site-specific DNA-methyltransferase [Methylococcales bacterium]|nr:site-specific DNA-methyltransferase [Methylococcales bacterium]
MADNYDDYSREELLRELRLRDRRPHFGLVWERKEIEHEKAVNDDFVALDVDLALSCGEAPYRNLIIEGDNFDALRYLRMTHAGKIKCIYIDPPYNTGNRDFIYNDRFVDKEDAYRHSKWLEFMYRRLQLARDLLAEDGVIFVSIDDNEVFNLGLLMNQVFGENNFVATNIWQKRYSASNDHKSIAPMHEYVFVYQASGAWKRNLLPRGEEKEKQYRLKDDKGIFRPDNYTCNKSADERPNLYYSIIQPNTGEEIWPKTTAAWRYSKERHEKNVSDDLIYWGKEGLGKVPAFKRYRHLLKNGDGVIPNTWWTFDEVGHTDSAKKELLDILAEHATAFSTPKPTQLIERILRIATKPNDIILDFFAGSGTTAHAVIKLNAEDGGNRRFILVSSTEATDSEPEKNLCRDVCAERVRRVMQGYTNKKGEAVAGMGGSFAYLRTRRIPAETLFSHIQHEAIWTALQLIHADSLSPFVVNTLIQQAVLENSTVLYVPKINAELLQRLCVLMANAASLLIYTWQPGLLRQHFDDDRLSFLPIPQFLVDRFGAGSKA